MRKVGIFRAFGILGSTTLLSRLTGYIRDAIIASYIGTTLYADSFFVAFRIPNMFRRLLGEGALTPTIIPVVCTLKDKEKRFRDEEIKSIITAGVFFLSIITILGIILSPILVKILAFGFMKNKELYELTVLLNRIMFPYLFFVCLVAIFMGILNAYNHFFAPSFSPVLLNLSMIFSTIIFAKFLPLPVYALAIGVIIGGISQVLLQIPYLKRHKIPLSLGTNLITESTKSIYTMLTPSVFGLAITQINILVDTLVASFLKEGTVSYLYYADRVLEIPIGVFVVSFATAILPFISESAKKGDNSETIKQFKKVFLFCLILTLPTMAIFLSFGKPIISTLFQRKAFNEISLRETYLALIGYSIGLPFFSFNRIITPLFYAYKKVKAPVIAGFYAMLTNISLDVILMQLGQLGLSLATSISAVVNGFFLNHLFKKHHFCLEMKLEAKKYLKILTSSTLAGILLYTAEKFFPYNHTFFIKFLALLISLFLYIILYIALLIFFKIDDFKEAIWDIKKRFMR